MEKCRSRLNKAEFEFKDTLGAPHRTDRVQVVIARADPERKLVMKQKQLLHDDAKKIDGLMDVPYMLPGTVPSAMALEKTERGSTVLILMPRYPSTAGALNSVPELRIRQICAQVARTLAHAYISPVLTAHPTEVQRKSIQNCQMAIARLLNERDRVQMTPEEAEQNEEALGRGIVTLWQTRK